MKGAVHSSISPKAIEHIELGKALLEFKVSAVYRVYVQAFILYCKVGFTPEKSVPVMSSREL